MTGLRAPSLEELSAAQTAEATSIDVSKGSQIVDYMGPAPPPKTGKHRYVFLLYKSGNGDHIEGPSDRKRWGNDESREGVRKWAKKYDLELIGMYNRSSMYEGYHRLTPVRAPTSSSRKISRNKSQLVRVRDYSSCNKDTEELGTWPKRQCY